MTEIYRGASRTLICVGPEAAQTARAFASLPTFVRAYDCVIEPRGGLQHTEAGDSERVCQLLQAESVDQPSLEGMSDLYHRPYFSRAWVFQEILLGGFRGEVICGRHKCDWKTMRKALIAFSCSKLHGISLKSYSLLHVMDCEDSFRAAGGLDLHELSDLRRLLGATDPRDKIYSALGVLHQRDRELVPDYDLTVQQVYTNAARYLIRTTRTLGSWWSVCNRASIRTIENLPSWVPDWTAKEPPSGMYIRDANFVQEVMYLGTRRFSGFVRGDPSTTATALRVNGSLLDKLDFGTSINWGDDIYEQVFKPVAIHLAGADRSIFEPYEHRPPASNLEAVWETISADNTKKGEILGFLAWKISIDDGIPEKARDAPSTYEPYILKWAGLSTTRPDYDFDISDAMEKTIHYSCDLVYTNKKRFGLTNLHGTERGLTVAILGGAMGLVLLRERGKQAERWYQHVDRIFLPSLEKAERLEDVDEHAKVERLEIR